MGTFQPMRRGMPTALAACACIIVVLMHSGGTLGGPPSQTEVCVQFWDTPGTETGLCGGTEITSFTAMAGSMAGMSDFEEPCTSILTSVGFAQAMMDLDAASPGDFAGIQSALIAYDPMVPGEAMVVLIDLASCDQMSYFLSPLAWISDYYYGRRRRDTALPATPPRPRREVSQDSCINHFHSFYGSISPGSVGVSVSVADGACPTPWTIFYATKSGIPFVIPLTADTRETLIDIASIATGIPKVAIRIIRAYLSSPVIMPGGLGSIAPIIKRRETTPDADVDFEFNVTGLTNGMGANFTAQGIQNDLDAASFSVTAVCYGENTNILLANGSVVRIPSLRPGMRVVDTAERVHTVRDVVASTAIDDMVRILPGALANNVPTHALYLTASHALQVLGRTVLAGEFASENEASPWVLQTRVGSNTRVYHIVLDGWVFLPVHGVPCETAATTHSHQAQRARMLLQGEEARGAGAGTGGIAKKDSGWESRDMANEVVWATAGQTAVGAACDN